MPPRATARNGAGKGAKNGAKNGRRVRLDAIDLKILRDLQEHGRMTNVDLAKRAGISAPPCLRRVRALEEAGYIRGYHAQVDPEALGFEVLFFVLVGLDSQAQEVLSAFESGMADWREVRECHMVRGAGDFLLKIVARNTAHEKRHHDPPDVGPPRHHGPDHPGHPKRQGTAGRPRGYGIADME